ncbi:MAG: OmpA family protein, partial [Candidatus Schekmanbacteria bacterium]
VNERGESINIEGKVYRIEYSLNEGAKEPSPLQIIRNYENAIKKIDGRIVFNKDPDKNKTWLEFEREGKIVDVHVLGDWGGYTLTIVERQKMKQDVVADPKSLANDILSKGHASVYGIYFDVDSDVIKSESEPTLKAISDMLKANPDMKVYIVGHTDMTGSFEHNMDLSLRRAKAVVKKLVSKYKISAHRLKAKGVGPLAPVSSNRDEKGRKLNRRVELVEML